MLRAEAREGKLGINLAGQSEIIEAGSKSERLTGMPSQSLQTWSSARAKLLDDIKHAHRLIRGTGAGARAAIQQINQAYVLLLSAQFQGFCRDFHSECADFYVAPVADPGLQHLLLAGLIRGRKIDRGNPNPGNIGSDFGRFIITFWTDILVHRAQNPSRKVALEELNDWRNAIAHQDFSTSMLQAGRPALRLSQVQAWRRACEGLAHSFDEVLKSSIQGLTGTSPW